MIRGVGPYSALFTPKAGSLFHAVFQLGIAPEFLDTKLKQAS